MKNLLLIAIIIISTLTSCDIQKKRYSRGFTVTKNKNYTSGLKHNPNQTSTFAVEKEMITKDTFIINQQINSAHIETVINIQKDKPENKYLENIKEPNNTISNTPEKFTSIKQQNTPVNSNLKRDTPTSHKLKKPETTKKKINKLSIIALVFIIIPFFGFIMAYIIAIKALKQIKSHPEKYKAGSKAIAIIATIPFYILLLIAIIFFISIFSYIGIVLGTLVLLILLLIGLSAPIQIYMTKEVIDEKRIPESPQPKKTEKPKPITNQQKKKTSNQTKLLVLFIFLFSALLLIPLTF